MMDTRIVMMDPTRMNVYHNVHRMNSDVKTDIVSIKSGAVMVLQIAEIIPMKWVRREKYMSHCKYYTEAKIRNVKMWHSTCFPNV